MAQKTGLVKENDEKRIEGSSASAPTASAGGLTDVNERTKATAAVGSDDDPEQIRAKIDDTRSEMEDTLDEIQERLSVQNITDQVSDQVHSVIETVKTSAYDATIGKAANFMREAGDEIRNTTIGRTVMANPIPFALIGAGTAMLLMNMRSGSASRGRYTVGPRYQRSYMGGSDTREDSIRGGSQAGTVERARRSYENTVNQAKHKAEDAYESVADAAGTAYSSVADAASTTYSGAADLVSRARERAGDLGHTVQDNYEYYAEEKPLALAAAALAVGAAVGFAIPSTRYESEVMGETRDNLLEKAEATAGQFVDQAKATATNAGKAATEELGLTGETGSQARSGTSSPGTKGSSSSTAPSNKNPSTR